MKKSIFLLLMLCLIGAAPANSQSLLKKVTGSMKDELLGRKPKEPEPACACSDAEQVLGLSSGSRQLDYKETEISTMDDGSLLMKNRMSGEYFIYKDGITTGPIKEGDPRLAGFTEDSNADDANTALLSRYKDYISKSGEKYIITFGGKKYGPYATIYQFYITKSKEKFAAQVIENILMTESEGKQMENAVKNAKTDQEKMDLAMQYSQQMLQKQMDGGGVSGTTPKIVSNIPGVSEESYTAMIGMINANAKYDDIVAVKFMDVNDLTGKTLLKLKLEDGSAPNLFINTANTKYATYNYGTLKISDGTTYTDLFNPHLIKTGSQVYLAYMYYSPKKNAIMQCKIPW